MNDIFFKAKEVSEICNAFECLNKATIKIVLPLNSKSITIFVCENCKTKFEDNNI